MCEKWNSGIGGYICDNCRGLLWAGFGGANDKNKRGYIYGVSPESIVESPDSFDVQGNYRAYCSQECKDTDRENY